MVRHESVRRLGRFLWVGTIVGVALLLAGASWGWGTRAAQAQERKQIFISALEQDGSPILDLTPGDVTVLEGQVAGKTVKVEPINWPMKLTVLVDNGARSSDYLSNLRAGLQGFFKEIPDGVETSLLSLAPQPRWLVRPTTDVQKVVKGLGLIFPDSAAGKFFDGLAEAGTRIEKEKGEYFPVIVLVTSDVDGGFTPLDRDYARLRKQIRERAVTVHVVLLASPSGGTGQQVSIGLGVTELSGGRFEKINAGSRLATLLPEIGQQIATSNFRQTTQYRVTYEPPPGNGNQAEAIFVRIAAAKKAVTIKPTLDGRLP